MKTRLLLFTTLSSLTLLAGGLPLPQAPLRLVISDVAGFDAALTGGYRSFLTGKAHSGDPLISAWRKTQVGSKLEDQWAKFAGDLPLTWDELRRLQPSSLGLSLLQVGHLEAVLVVETPLAELPLALPSGEGKSHGGVNYTLVTAGAADASEDPDRRMGLAWARMGQRLILATSERSLKLTIDEAQAGRGFTPALTGLVSMELDLEALRKDRYFVREFPFPEGPETGLVRTALRREGNHLVEVREGTNETRGAAFVFEAAPAAIAGWEPAGTAFWPAFRRGVLEPIPHPLDKPVPAIRPLPAPASAATEDRYATNFTKPKVATGTEPWEEGDLRPWQTLLEQSPVSNWGFWVSPDGARRMVFPWPQNRDAEFLEHCRATLARRAGRATAVKLGDIQEIQVGPGLPALALRRTGECLWVAHSARELKDLPTPKPENGLVRWAKADLTTVRAEAARWAKTEGPARPEQMRPFSDRVLGLLGWMPETKSISVERRKTEKGWTERVVFGNGSGK